MARRIWEEPEALVEVDAKAMDERDRAWQRVQGHRDERVGPRWLYPAFLAAWVVLWGALVAGASWWIGKTIIDHLTATGGMK